MKEVLMLLLFLGLYFILPYAGAWWMIKKVRKRWKKLNTDSFGWRIINGIVFLGLALITFAVVLSIVVLIKTAIA
ncbi:MAG: hypothetical protein ACK5Z2_08545 [Bacteroidota bacterium]|jgi:hypothetical protein